VRKNFILIYELLDEMMDFGYIQGTSTEILKAYVFNEPIEVEQKTQSIVDRVIADRRTTPSSATNKPISSNFENSRQQKK